MTVMMETQQLGRHADALRRYLLLGQGDFVQALMDQVGGVNNWECWWIMCGGENTVMERRLCQGRGGDWEGWRMNRK